MSVETFPPIMIHRFIFTETSRALARPTRPHCLMLHEIPTPNTTPNMLARISG